MAMIMIRKRPWLLPETGFTLIELLVVLAISGIIAKIIMSVFIDQQKSYKAQIGISALQQNVRTAMNMITEDIRMAGYYTFLNNHRYRNYIDWNPVQKGLDEFIPLIQIALCLDGLARVPHALSQYPGNHRNALRLPGQDDRTAD